MSVIRSGPKGSSRNVLYLGCSASPINGINFMLKINSNIYLIIVIIFLLQTKLVSAENWKNCNLQKGDIAFFIYDDKSTKNDEVDSFGKAVIASHKSASVFHNAIIYGTTNRISIIHADTKGVVNESLQKVYEDENIDKNVKIKFFRVDKNIGEKAADCAHSYIGHPYNDIFANNQINSQGQHSFYCSQLVEFCFNKVTTAPIFHKHPLNFRDANGNLSEYWVKYFQERGMEVPEQDIGTHPGSLYEIAIIGLIPIECN